MLTRWSRAHSTASRALLLAPAPSPSEGFNASMSHASFEPLARHHERYRGRKTVDRPAIQHGFVTCLCSLGHLASLWTCGPGLADCLLDPLQRMGASRSGASILCQSLTHQVSASGSYSTKPGAHNVMGAQRGPH